MRSRLSRRTLRTLALVAGVVAMAVVIWVDVATGVWQEVVILSGIAAGLLTFLLTALFLQRWVARADHERWLPVTRIALTDMLHALADEERSEITRGVVVPRLLRLDDDAADTDAAGTHAALTRIHAERAELTTALERWAAFLAASADVQELMIHVAQIAGLLDELRDAVVERERHGSTPGSSVARLTEEYNAAVTSAVAEIEGLLARDAAVRRAVS